MKDIAAYIESGILEVYVLGMASDAEIREVEAMAMVHPEISAEIAAIGDALEAVARQNAIAPHATVKPMVLASINYIERLQSGEAPAFPPLLSEHSRIGDYAQWLDRKDLDPVDEINDIYVRLIGHTPVATTALVWIRTMAPLEVHDNEHERFLILEGTCDIYVGDDEVHHLVPGDYFEIPLHKMHQVKVTSDIPCKVILQRVAA
jgi:mannose-6-phosphate isomerase-like protein (cupin superfamily)